MLDPNIAEIAGKLSEAEQDRLLYGYLYPVGWANVSVNGRPTHIPKLAEHGLLERATGLDGQPNCMFYKATPLGLAVRAHLQEQAR